MSASDDLDRLFKALKSHKELIIDAHLEGDGFVDETPENEKAVNELIRLGLLWRMDDDAGRARLSHSFTDVMNVARRDELRRHVNVDIGERLTTIEEMVESYRKARRYGTLEEQELAYRSIEEQVYSLRENLAAVSRQLWREVEGEFGYVSTLELKLQENHRVIERVKRLNDNLALLDYPTLSGERFAGEDPRLRRLFTGAFVRQISNIREELVDALHRLDGMLFVFRKQQRQGRVVQALYRRFQKDPGFHPANYATQTRIPSLLNQVQAIPLTGHADLDNDRDEITFTQLIQNLRKQPPASGQAVDTPRIQVDENGEAEVEEIETDPLGEAVHRFYLAAGDGAPVRAMAHFALAPDECPADIWLFAIASRHTMMSVAELESFKMTFLDETDPIFDGRHLVNDIEVALR
ncbi:MAG: hypothetical protein ABW148_16290 [Sedimenticola sp.]